MAYQSIGLGTTEGDGTGDTLRIGGDKVNDNFVEIYTLLGTGTALTSGISASSSVVTLAGPSITGVASFADGSVSAPSITNTGDTNTGIFFSAADKVNVTTGGTERIEIDSAGLAVVGAVAATGAVSGTTGTFSSTMQGTTITATTAFVPDAQDGAALGTSSLQFSDLFLADSAAMFFGDDNEVALTHVHNTGLLLNAAMVLQFRDAAINIGSPADGDLDINADDEIELNSTLVDINGAVDISGVTHIDGVLTQGVEGDLHGGGVIMDASDGSSTDAGDEILLNGTDGSSTNANEKLILEYATQFTTAVLQIKNSDGIVISSLYGTSGF
tara:strand:+ start:1797 stop:2783 length:987 start_codon:yes stop_codon:yes gene_type:complete